MLTHQKRHSDNSRGAHGIEDDRSLASSQPMPVQNRCHPSRKKARSAGPMESRRAFAGRAWHHPLQ